MMQKISLNKSALNLFAFTLKKNLGFSLLASIFVFIVSPIYIYNVIQEYLFTYSKLIYQFDNMLVIFSTVMAVATMLFFMVLLYINFSFLFNKSASDYFHALPLKRWELLSARFSGSFVAAVIPLTVGYIGTYVISLFDFVEANSVKVINAYLFTLLMMLLLGLFTLLFIITAGGIFDSLISLFAVNIGVPIIVSYIISLCTEHIYGFTFEGDLDTSILTFTTPFGYALIKLLIVLTGEGKFFALTGGDESYTVKSLLGTIAAIIILAAVLFIIFKRRKSEKLGGSYAFKFVPEVIGLIISSIGLFFFGYIFGEDPHNLMYWVMGTVGAIITAVVYSLIINRGFKKVKRAIIVGAIASVVLIGVNMGIKFDITGYRYNLPTAEKIESVKIQSGVMNINVRNIDLAVELNRAIVNEHNEDYLGSDRTNVFTFTYTLKNGKTLTRRYDVETGIAKEQKSRLIAEEYSRSILEEFNEFKKKKADSWSLNGYLYNNREYMGNFEANISEEKAEEFVVAYATDLKTYGNQYFVDLADVGLSSLMISGNKAVNTYQEIDRDGELSTHTDYEDFYISVENYEKFYNVKKVLSTVQYELIPEDTEKY